MSYEEYRAEALTKLGADFELEDLRNEERWRLKVLEALDNYSGGGGGSSDFSTAEVTITNSTISNITQSCIMVIEMMGEQAMTTEFPILADDSVTGDIVLFKGTQIIYAPDDVHITVTGDITDDGGEITITGAGTITYSTK